MSIYKAIYHKIKLTYIQDKIFDYLKKEDLEYYLKCFCPTGSPVAYIEMISQEDPNQISKEIIECYKEKYGNSSAYFPSLEKELYEIIRSLMTNGFINITTRQDKYVITNLCNILEEIGIYYYNYDGSLDYYFSLDAPSTESD